MQPPKISVRSEEHNMLRVAKNGIMLDSLLASFQPEWGATYCTADCGRAVGMSSVLFLVDTILSKT